LLVYKKMWFEDEDCNKLHHQFAN